MPAETILILAGILLAFTLFGVALAATDFYTNNHVRPRPGSETE
jgi:hypothetical protein